MANNTLDFSIFLKKWKVILVFVLIAFVIGFCKASFFSKPVYVCTSAYSVRNSEVYINDDYSKASTVGDTQVSQYLVELYSECLDMKEFLIPLADYMNNDIGYNLKNKISASALSSAISVERIGDVGLMRIRVTTADYALTADISRALNEYLLPKISEDLGYAEIKLQGEPMEPSEKRDGPIQSGIKFGLLGALLAIIYIFAASMLNNKVTDENELSKKFGIPVLGTIPDPTVKQKGGMRYGR